MAEDKKHTFTIAGSGIGYIGGNYKNKNPSDAAKKAGKALFKKLENAKFRKYKNKTSIRFILRMRDRSGPGKTYSYEVTRSKLKEPKVVKRGDVTYTINYDYSVKPCEMPDAEVKKMSGGAISTISSKRLKGGMGDADVEDSFDDDSDQEEIGGDAEDDAEEEDDGDAEAEEENDADVDTGDSLMGGKKGKKASRKHNAEKKVANKKKGKAKTKAK